MGTWAYSDERVGITDEAFVAGSDQILDMLRERYCGIENPDDPFRITFSAQPFPTALEATFAGLGEAEDFKTKKKRVSGAWYELGDMRGWLCDRLYDYFPTAPESIFIRADRLPDDAPELHQLAPRFAS